MTTGNEARIYVGTYAKYNEGSLKGAWLDLADYSDKDEFLEACSELHKDESDPELMFQDYENFPARFYSESGVTDKLWEYLEAIANLDADRIEAYEDFVANGDSESVEDFEASYQGEYRSMTEFAEQFAEDCGYLSQIPENLQCYFDFERFGRDLELGGDYWISDNGHVFSSNY